MLDSQIRNELAAVVEPDRLLERPEELACYSYDAYFVEAMPDMVLFPVSTEEVSKILKICSTHDIPVTARGAGTSVCGPRCLKYGVFARLAPDMYSEDVTVPAGRIPADKNNTEEWERVEQAFDEIVRVATELTGTLNPGKFV